MACLIRNNADVKGMSTPWGESRKLSQFADDTVLLLQDKKSWEACLQSIETFNKASNMALNEDKTEAMWVGPKAMRPQIGDLFTHQGKRIKWATPHQYIRSLGCPMTNSSNLATCWANKYDKILYRLNNWSRLNPSLDKRILIRGQNRTTSIVRVLSYFGSLHPAWKVCFRLVAYLLLIRYPEISLKVLVPGFPFC